MNNSVDEAKAWMRKYFNGASILATQTAYLNLLDLITLTKLGER